jgi:hypothetical protein
MVFQVASIRKIYDLSVNLSKCKWMPRQWMPRQAGGRSGQVHNTPIHLRVLRHIKGNVEGTQALALP